MHYTGLAFKMSYSSLNDHYVDLCKECALAGSNFIVLKNMVTNVLLFFPLPFIDKSHHLNYNEYTASVA